MTGSAPLYLLLLGAPGAGKGTQAAFLTEKLGIPHVASGDLFREAIAKQTELGKLAKGYMDRGELVPDDVTIAMVMERLSQDDCAKGAILDGFPRTIAQAQALEGALAERGASLTKAIYIAVSEDALVERLSGRWTCRQCGAVYHERFNPPKVPGVCDVCGGELYQRPDDTPETQRRRIRVYMEQTAPLIDYFAAGGLLAEVDGGKGVEDVRDAVWEVVQPLNGGLQG